MDPNATLMELRNLVKECRSLARVPDDSELLEQIVERIEALDEWISRGGFLPDAWRR